MEEVCTCKVCKSQKWIVYSYKIECSNCRKTYEFSNDVYAEDLVNLTNDNY